MLGLAVRELRVRVAGQIMYTKSPFDPMLLGGLGLLRNPLLISKRILFFQPLQESQKAFSSEILLYLNIANGLHTIFYPSMILETFPVLNWSSPWVHEV